ncbi:hypothetical protein IRY55_01010 [Savagea sp. SN6]|uniref:Flagellar hook-length control protein-like C-terminal domain-containing protein n=1 Tax=Savagea serpentis TaxID=2785297 RepID=A0A8J7KKG2_9BACL|nr:hypothetical protein [Savagea serpentis]MBF4499924.1 hypothetical protein [Savagea serpentis]
MQIQAQMTAQTNTVERQPLAMREGQVFHGKISQLFPNQTAQIQIGQQEMVAKLEVPMKAGDSHYFQVVKTEPELQLRVISEPLSSDPKQSLQQLMQNLKLPQSKEMQQIVRQMLDQKVPLTREQLVQAEQILKAMPQGKAEQVVRAVAQLNQLQLPITESNVRSFIAVMNRDPLQAPLQQAMTLIMQDAKIPEAMKQQLAEVFHRISTPIQQGAQSVVHQEALQQLMTKQETPMTRILMNDVIARIVQTPTGEQLTQLAAKGTDAQIHQVQQLTKALQQILASPPAERPAQLTQLAQQLPQMTTLQPATVEQLSAQLQRAITALTAQTSTGQPVLQENAPQQLVQQMIQTLTQEAHALKQTAPLTTSTEQLATAERIPPQVMERLVQLMQEPGAQARAEANIMQQLDGEAIKQVLKQTIQQLGLNYESQIPRATPEHLAQLTQQLKPQLIQLLQSETLTLQTKEAVEQLVARMNAPIIQTSQEQSLPQQIIMNVPLDFLGKKIDATLQWSGKMTDDGKIDENYARILFYLKLETLKETIVDMQVQNRIVTLTIFNETPHLQKLSTQFEDRLKEGLEQHRYKLSGLFFKTIEERHAPKPKKQSFTQQPKRSGVDIRI